METLSVGAIFADWSPSKLARPMWEGFECVDEGGFEASNHLSWVVMIEDPDGSRRSESNNCSVKNGQYG